MQIRDTHSFNPRERERAFSIHFCFDPSAGIFELKPMNICFFASDAMSTNRIELDTISARSAQYAVLMLLR
jgi:hypothetical protein